ncbi:MAG: hypothetical protein IJM09_00670 [Neisseriaceae bacterium]|nr:hypothetical protein [Neisseriaceae bacterium]
MTASIYRRLPRFERKFKSRNDEYGNLKNILQCRCIDLRHPKIIFNFISLFKNNFRRRQIAVSNLLLTDMSLRAV